MRIKHLNHAPDRSRTCDLLLHPASTKDERNEQIGPTKGLRPAILGHKIGSGPATKAATVCRATRGSLVLSSRSTATESQRPGGATLKIIASHATAEAIPVEEWRRQRNPCPARRQPPNLEIPRQRSPLPARKTRPALGRIAWPPECR